MTYCPCGTNKKYDECCGIYLSGQKSASTPETLMRSRYTAYHRADLDYIEKTMKSPAADDFNRQEALHRAEKIQWTRLEIVKTDGNATRGFVEFRAHYCCDHKKYVLHETSEFHFEQGAWYYVDGILHNTHLK